MPVSEVQNPDLARDYVRRAAVRVRALETLYDAESWPDVVRESQEIVELALKGLLLACGVEPPPPWSTMFRMCCSRDEAGFRARSLRRFPGWRKHPASCGATGSWPSTGRPISPLPASTPGRMPTGPVRPPGPLPP